MKGLHVVAFITQLNFLTHITLMHFMLYGLQMQYRHNSPHDAASICYYYISTLALDTYNIMNCMK